MRASTNTVDYRARAQQYATELYGQYGAISISASGDVTLSPRMQHHQQSEQQASSSARVQER